MPAIEPEAALEAAFTAGKVRRKPNTTQRLRARAARIAKGCPEVMVKITGFCQGSSHIKSHLNYISRNGKVQVENDRGENLAGRDAIKAFFKDWAPDLDDVPRRKNQRDIMRMVLSMPEDTPETAVLDAARAFARKTFGGNHEYVLALHTDEPHPHVHLTVKMRGFDGRRLNPRKADLHDWRDAFAQEMRDQGVDAEATPRPLRGVVRKPQRGIVRHIERGDKTHNSRVPRVTAAQVKEAARELAAEASGAPATIKPWEDAIEKRQSATRAAWLSAAATLAATNTPLQGTKNARPDYDRLQPARVRAGQRAAALYQSDLERSGRKAPATAVSRLRDVSRLDLVHDKRPAQVLLLAHAPDRLGPHRPANHDLRWTRAGAAGLADGREQVNGEGRGLANKALVARIRGFVDSMPPVATKHQRLKQQLQEQFFDAGGDREARRNRHESDRGAPDRD
jgi:type IV secretory pathway VirD2 relaxase